MDPRLAPRRALAAALMIAVAACGGTARRAAGPRFDFAHGIELFQTTNGMRFALLADHRTNLATIDVRYDVGAGADPEGLSGLAHLVEHLMFEVRATPGEPTLGDQLEELALYSNASTTWDETHYTSTVPAAQVEHAIALEGARMAATCDQLDDALIARERDIVLAETTERASPGADVVMQLHRLVYGADHPYGRDLGSREIAKATRADVCAFIEAHYAPRNAYLVVTGPFEIDALRGVVGRTFGPIPPRATEDPSPVPVPVLAGGSERITAPVLHPAAVVVFDHPAWGSMGALPHALGARLLSEQLEEADSDSDWIVGTGVSVLGGPRAPLLAAIVEVEDPARLESAADEVFRRAALLRTYGDFDVAPAVSSVVLGQMSRWDDLMGRGSWIADFLQYANHDWFMLEDLRAAAEGWERHRAEVADGLGPDHARIILVERGAAGRGRLVEARPTGTHDLAPWRPAVDPADADQALSIEQTPPPVAVEQYTLTNGLQVMLAPDPASPLVDARLIFPVGTAHQPVDQELLAVAATALLRNPQRVVSRSGGVRVRGVIADAVVREDDVDETSTTFAIRGLAEASGGFVRALEHRLHRGVYDPGTLAAIKSVADDLDDDDDAAEDDEEPLREQRFRERLFGRGHPYAAPPIAIGPALHGVEVELLEAWRKDHFRARGATLIVSGRFDPAVVKRDVEATFGAWPGDAPAELPRVPTAHPPPGPSWLAIEDRRASQVRVRVGFAAGSDTRRQRAARAVLAAMVLDELRDVREGLGASYGVHDRYLGGAAGSALLADGMIDEARAEVAIPRLLAAIDRLRDDDATRRAAFVRARRRVLGEVQARVAGASKMASVLADVARAGTDATDLDRRAAEVAGLTFAEVTEVARLDLAREHMVVELRGRRGATAAGFAALSVTPAWMGEEAELGDGGAVASVEPTGPSAEVTEPDRPAPPPRPARPPPPPVVEPALAPIDPAEKLAVGDPYSGTGPRTPGLYRGEREISLDAFLRLTGHGDQADDVRNRKVLRLGLTIGGFGTLAATVVIGAASLEGCDELNPGSLEQEECDLRNNQRKIRMFTGIVVGGVLGAIGVNLSNLRPQDATLRRYADEHNYRRRRGSDRAAPSVTVSPAVTAGGVGLTVGGRF